MSARNHLLSALVATYQYREEPFRLSSGQDSHEYLDCRAALSHPRTLTLAADCILELLDSDACAVGGLTMGADPLAIATSLQSLNLNWWPGVRWFSVRKEPKAHGTGRRIEGDVLRGSKVVVLEDVSTTGASAKMAADACTEAGLQVVQVIPLVDRGGVCKLRELLPGVPVTPVLTFDEISVAGRNVSSPHG